MIAIRKFTIELKLELKYLKKTIRTKILKNYIKPYSFMAEQTKT